MLINSSKPDVAVFIGRMQPLHFGHLSVIKLALQSAKHLIIALGSARSPSGFFNPFSYSDRRHMVSACLTDSEMQRVSFVAIGDHLYNDDAWIAEVHREVMRVARAMHGNNPTISLIGNAKDATGYFLKLFPEWESISAPTFQSLSATPMRNLYFSKNSANWLDNQAKDCLPPEVIDWLKNFSGTKAYEEMVKEFTFIRDYSSTWGKGPFITLDACVVQSSYILLIRRGGRPGKNQWALPGGFLDIKKSETLQQGMMRELNEETKLDVPPEIIRSNIVMSEAFDAPYRDPRARIITHAFLINLPKRIDLPKIRAADDAAHAQWVPYADLKEEEMFSDHFHIINRLKGFLPK